MDVTYLTVGKWQKRNAVTSDHVNSIIIHKYNITNASTSEVMFSISYR